MTEAIVDATGCLRGLCMHARPESHDRRRSIASRALPGPSMHPLLRPTRLSRGPATEREHLLLHAAARSARTSGAGGEGPAAVARAGRFGGWGRGVFLPFVHCQIDLDMKTNQVSVHIPGHARRRARAPYNLSTAKTFKSVQTASKRKLCQNRL